MVHSARVVALPNPKFPAPTQQAVLHPLAPKPVSVLARAVRIGTGIVTQLAPPVLTIAFLLILWQILASSPTSALPSPLKVIDESWEIIVNPFKVGNGIDQGLFWHVTASLVRVGYGYTLAAIVGIGAGVLLGQSTLAMRGLDPVFQVLRTIPPLAWLPLSLAAFRDGQPSAIFVIFITSVWPILINTSVGIRNIPQDYRNVAKVLRLSPIEFFTRIMVPATVPHMFTGLRIGIGLSWLAIVAAEMLIGGVGIGFFIWDAWNSSLISDIIVALVYVGVVGFVLDRSIAAIGHLLTRGTAAQ
jgi:nitrate/nitrite transport system permease protein